MDDDSLLDELQEDLGSDYSPQLRVATGMLSGDAQAAVPFLLFAMTSAYCRDTTQPSATCPTVASALGPSAAMYTGIRCSMSTWRPSR